MSVAANYLLREIFFEVSRGELTTTSDIYISIVKIAAFIEATEYGSAIAVNHEIAHLNNDHLIKDGDLVKVDSWFKVKGVWIDGATTMIAGYYKLGQKHNQDALRLVRATNEALSNALSRVRNGTLISDIGAAIEDTATKYDVNIIRKLSGHGIGTNLHQGPRIRNFFNIDDNTRLKTGDRIAIEPLFTLGNGAMGETVDEKGVSQLNWLTDDLSLASHCEATVEVTETGYIHRYGWSMYHMY